MSLPGFNAEASLHTSGRTYRGRYQYGHLSASQQGLPALVLPSQLEALEEMEVEDEMGLIDEGLGMEEMEVEDGRQAGARWSGLPSALSKSGVRRSAPGSCSKEKRNGAKRHGG